MNETLDLAECARLGHSNLGLSTELKNYQQMKNSPGGNRLFLQAEARAPSKPAQFQDVLGRYIVSCCARDGHSPKAKPGHHLDGRV